jgi:hypothetical protein
VAIEVQLGEISDTQWLARHRDYAQAGIADVWLWHQTIWVPRVLFAHHQPGWLLDLNAGQIGLIHAQPARATTYTEHESPECGQTHWPPCPQDRLGVRWMPLVSAQLTHQGIQPSPQAAAGLANRAAKPRKHAAASAKQAARPRTSVRDNQVTASMPATGRTPDERSQPGQTRQAHRAFRYDAFPPWADPDAWWFYCDTCARSFTGTEIKANPNIHAVPSAGPLTSTGQQLISYTQYGSTPPQPISQNPAAQGT